MQATIEGGVLVKAARAVKAVAGVGCYGNLRDLARIVTTPQGIEVKCMGSDAWLRCSIECDAGAGRQAFIDSTRLLGAVKGRKGPQEFQVDACGTMHIGAMEIEAAGPEAALDFPVQPEYSENVAHVYSFMGSQFKSMVAHHKCTSMKAGQTTRLNLTCVNVEYSEVGKGAWFTTTDGYSLTRERFGAQIAGSEIKQALVPMEYLVKAAAAVGPRDIVNLDVLHSIGDDVTSIMRIRTVNSAGSEIEYFIRCVSEQFPDFQRVIPAVDRGKVQFAIEDTSEFSRLVSEALQCAPEDSRAVKLEVIPRSSEGSLVDRLHISSSSPAGKYSNSMEIIVPRYWDPQAAPVWFDGAYLKKVSGFTSGTLNVILSDPLQAARFDYDGDQVAVLMPVNMDPS